MAVYRNSSALATRNNLLDAIPTPRWRYYLLIAAEPDDMRHRQAYSRLGWWLRRIGIDLKKPGGGSTSGLLTLRNAQTMTTHLHARAGWSPPRLAGTGLGSAPGAMPQDGQRRPRASRAPVPRADVAVTLILPGSGNPGAGQG